MPNEITVSVLFVSFTIATYLLLQQVKYNWGALFFSVLEEKYDEKKLLYIVSVFT